MTSHKNNKYAPQYTTSSKNIDFKLGFPVSIIFGLEELFFDGIHAFDKNRRKIAPKGLRERAVRKQNLIDFFAPGGESASKSIASARFRTPRGTPKKLFFFTRTFFWTLRTLPGRSRGASGMLRIVAGSSLGALVTPKTLPASILDRFWEPRRLPGI